MTTDNPESIWTRPFALLCLAEFLGYAQHFILQPTFPLYITQLGGSPFHVGLVIASFGVASVMSRPLLGYWADRWSVTGVMILGLFLQTLSISLCFVPFIVALMFANGLRGIGWSGMNTGGYTLLATSAPAARRGEASGYYGGVQSSATILFPAVRFGSSRRRSAASARRFCSPCRWCCSARARPLPCRGQSLNRRISLPTVPRSPGGAKS